MIKKKQPEKKEENQNLVMLQKSKEKAFQRGNREAKWEIKTDDLTQSSVWEKPGL